MTEDELKVLDSLVSSAIYKGCGGTFQADLWQQMKAENAKLREMIKISTEMENENPGCLECAKLKDEKALAEGKTSWDVANEAYYHYRAEEVLKPLTERYNTLHTELTRRTGKRR